MKRIINKKSIIAWLLTLTMIAGIVTVSANEAETAQSRSFVVESVDGTDATMTKGTLREFPVRAGTRLAAGNTITTGRDTKIVIKLDDNSTITMNSSTKVDVSQLNRNELLVTVVTGTIAVNATELPQESTTRFKAGNTTMGVRGTLFTIGNSTGNWQVVLLEGTLAVSNPAGDFDLEAGHILQILGATEIAAEGSVNVIPLDFAHIPDSFTLELIQENADMLIELGIITAEDAAQLDTLITEAKAEEARQEEAIAQAQQQQQNTIVAQQQTVIYLGMGTGTGTRTGGTGTGGGTTPPTTPDPLAPTEPEQPDSSPEPPPPSPEPPQITPNPEPEPQETYGILLSNLYGQLIEIDFATRPVGDTNTTGSTITIINTGTMPTGSLNITLSGPGAGGFTVTPAIVDNIAPDSSSTFNLQVNNNLPAGIYEATVTVSGTNVTSQSLNVRITIIGFLVTTAGQLEYALNNAGAGDTILISDDIIYDIGPIMINPGVQVIIAKNGVLTVQTYLNSQSGVIMDIYGSLELLNYLSTSIFYGTMNIYEDGKLLLDGTLDIFGTVNNAGSFLNNMPDAVININNDGHFNNNNDLSVGDGDLVIRSNGTLTNNGQTNLENGTIESLSTTPFEINGAMLIIGYFGEIINIDLSGTSFISGPQGPTELTLTDCIVRDNIFMYTGGSVPIPAGTLVTNIFNWDDSTGHWIAQNLNQ